MFYIHIPSYSQSSILLYTFFPDFLLYYISIFVCRLRFFGGIRNAYAAVVCCCCC